MSLFKDKKLDEDISNFMYRCFLKFQTQDTITCDAMQRLKKNLSIEYILNIPLDELANIIKPVGFIIKNIISKKFVTM